MSRTVSVKRNLNLRCNMKYVTAAAMAVGLMLGAVAAQAKEAPMSVTGATTVDNAKAKAMFEKGVPFVDVRSDKDWGAGRIPGAVHLELNKAFSEGSLAKVAKKDQDVVIYCNGAECLRSSEASEKAVKWGFRKVHYYRDGYPSWKKAGNPTE